MVDLLGLDGAAVEESGFLKRVNQMVGDEAAGSAAASGWDLFTV